MKKCILTLARGASDGIVTVQQLMYLLCQTCVVHCQGPQGEGPDLLSPRMVRETPFGSLCSHFYFSSFCYLQFGDYSSFYSFNLVFLNEGDFVLHSPSTQGGIWQCLESFLGVTAGEGVPLATRTAKHPTMHRAGSHNKELSSSKCQ